MLSDGVTLIIIKNIYIYNTCDKGLIVMNRTVASQVFHPPSDANVTV